MGKISNIMENGIAGLASTLEFQKQSSEKNNPESLAKMTVAEKRAGFISFVFSEKINRIYLLIAIAGIIVQFVFFKLLYPFPDFISDSYSYIDTNIYNMDVNLWPIGYSKFLLWVHMISHSDTFLIASQYLMLETALAYFYFSFLYLYRPKKTMVVIMYLFIFFNPLFLYLSNSVLSDSLFTALTIVFITQFLWMFLRPTVSQVIVQGVIIGIAFTVRYTAIYYPAVALVGLLLSRHRTITKVIGALIPLLMIIPFYLYTSQKTKERTGTAEFSVFGGWQIANNSLYMYDHISVNKSELPSGTEGVDLLAREFYKKVPPEYRNFSSFPGTYFIKVPYAILKPYMEERYSFTDPIGQFKAWGEVSPIYKKYGTFLIIHHPLAFARYYLLFNTANYFLPHLEKFDIYNRGIKTVPVTVQDWFGYVTNDITSISPTFQGKLFYAYPIIFMVLNLYVLGNLLLLLIRRKTKRFSPFFKVTCLFSLVFLVCNFLFSIFATPVVFRYEIVPLIVLLMLSLLFLEFPFNPNQLKIEN